MTPQTYRLLIVSPVPVSIENGIYQSLDLWVEDLQANLAYVSELTLISPRADQAIIKTYTEKLLPSSIKVILHDQVSGEDDLKLIISQHDVVSIGVGAPAWRMKIAIQVAKLSVKLRRCLIISVSSNRAKTTLMNATHQSWLKKIKSHIVAWSIQHTTNYLVRISSGVFVVGEGVRQSMHFAHKNIYVETAAWVNEQNIINDTNFANKLHSIQNGLPAAIIATRLEPMKGVYLAIDALIEIKKQAPKLPKLSILGNGPLLKDLQLMVKKFDLSNQITFDGVRAYPEEFFAELARFHLILLTNLNDEQPRLIFDSISQGLIPVCPDSSAYQYLKLPPEIMYEKGNAASLAKTWISLCDKNTYMRAMLQLRPFAIEYTINNMHRKRNIWIRQSLASSQ